GAAQLTAAFHCYILIKNDVIYDAVLADNSVLHNNAIAYDRSFADMYAPKQNTVNHRPLDDAAVRNERVARLRTFCVARRRFILDLCINRTWLEEQALPDIRTQ